MARNILLQTPDVQAAAAFYRDALGMQVFLLTPDLAGLDAGGVHLFLETGAHLGPVLECRTENFATSRADLEARGCTVLLDDPTIPRCYLRDPFGLVFNLVRQDGAAATEGEEEPEIGPADEKPPHY